MGAVEQDGDEGLSGTCVGDDLRGEKDALGVGCIIINWSVILFFDPFEEEDESIYWSVGVG